MYFVFVLVLDCVSIVCLFVFFFFKRIWNYITKIQILLLLLTAHVKHGNLFIDEVN